MTEPNGNRGGKWGPGPGLAALNNAREQARADTWPAPIAERLEAAVRKCHEDEIEYAGSPFCWTIDILAFIDAARSRGEIPPRKETP